MQKFKLFILCAVKLFHKIFIQLSAVQKYKKVKLVKSKNTKISL